MRLARTRAPPGAGFEQREGRFPQDAVVLTFDDGFLSVCGPAGAGGPRLHGYGLLASGLVGLTAPKRAAGIQTPTVTCWTGAGHRIAASRLGDRLTTVSQQPDPPAPRRASANWRMPGRNWSKPCRPW
jgi:hypothetical protein